MAEHLPPIPLAIEQVVAGLTELEALFGEAGRGVMQSVRACLIEAMAARDRGDAAATLELIGRGMAQLAALADRLDPQEAMMMRVLAERFQTALRRGDQGGAKQDLQAMFERSGAREIKKPGGS